MIDTVSASSNNEMHIGYRKSKLQSNKMIKFELIDHQKEDSEDIFDKNYARFIAGKVRVLDIYDVNDQSKKYCLCQ